MFDRGAKGGRVEGNHLLFALATAILGCNAITGVDDLHVGAAEDAAGAGGSSSSRPGTGGHAASTTGTGGSSSTVGGTTTGPGTGGSGPGGSAPTSSSTGAMPPTCSPACGTNERCETETTTCVCQPGFSRESGVCTAVLPGDPTTHTQADVCDHWSAGHQVTTPDALVASGAACDAGSLKSGAIADALTRINMFRWLVGLGPVVDDAQLDADAQLCANLESWWSFDPTQNAHAPPSTSKCYTAAGGSTAGQSNIAWGCGSPAQMMDQFITDNGNETTLGHRRWVLNPPLDPIGIGYWQTGGQYGNAACLRVFGASGTGPNPPFTSIPPAGFTPIELTQPTWSFEGGLGGIPGATASVLRVDDATPMPVTMHALSQGYGQDAISWTLNGWTAEVGKTYRVTITGLSAGDVVYDVKPVSCP